MDMHSNRDARAEALEDLIHAQDDIRPEPGMGARMALRATEIEREELMGVPQPTGMWARLTSWLRSRRS